MEGSTTPYMDPDFPATLKNLRESGLYERKYINNAYADTVLHVSFARDLVGSQFELVCKALLAGGSLMCVPVDFDSHLSMTIVIAYPERVVASYPYSDNLHDYLFTLEDPGEDINGMIGVLRSRFYSDLQNDRLFENDALGEVGGEGAGIGP